MKLSAKRRLFWRSVFLWSVIIIILAMTTIPLFTAMLWAFVDPQYGWSYREILPAHFALDNWRNIFMYTGIVQAIGASFGIAATTTVVCLILSLPTSYAISRINQKAKEACKVIMLVPLVLPGMVVAIFLSRILLMFGLSQNSLGIVLGHVFIAIPYMLRLLTVSFESVPDNLADAARNLGAGKLSIFVEIIVPSVLPGIAAGMLFSFIASMEEFNLAFIIGTPGIQTITTVLYSYLGQNLAKPSSSVVSLILVVPNIILMLVAERYIKTEHLGAALGKM